MKPLHVAKFAGPRAARRLGVGSWSRHALFGLLLSPAFAGWSAASAQTLEAVLPPVADVSIFSSGDNVADAKGTYIWTSVLASGTKRRLLLRFDLRAIPPGAQVREVRLELYQSRAVGDHDLHLHRVQSAWTTGLADGGGQGEGAPATNGDVTWGFRSFSNTPGSALPWLTPGGDFDATASAVLRVPAASQWYIWQSLAPALAPASAGGLNPKMTADVQAWIANPASNHGWILIGDETGERNAKRFQSTRSGSEAPRLRVLYTSAALDPHADVPLPAWAIGALAIAMAGALLRRGSRRGNP